MESIEEDSEASNERLSKNLQSFVTEDAIDFFTRGSKAVTAGVVAVTGLMTLFGLIEVVAFSYQEPSGFPRFEPSSLAELLIPIALSGAFIIITISVALGLPGYIFGNYEYPIKNKTKLGNELHSGAPQAPGNDEPKSDKKCLADPFPDSEKSDSVDTSALVDISQASQSNKLKHPSTELPKPLVFFGLLAVESLLWYVVNAFGSVIESNWPGILYYKLFPAVNSTSFWLITLASLPLPAVFFTEIISTDYLKLQKTTWPMWLVQAFSGIVWLLPFIFSAGIAAGSTKIQWVFWQYLFALTFVAVVGNSFTSLKRNTYKALGVFLILVVTLIISPRALLGAPLRALGMVDASRILTIREDERGEFNSLVDSCHSIVAVDIPKKTEAIKAALSKHKSKTVKATDAKSKSSKTIGTGPDRMEPIARHRVLIQNELGKDLVLECNPPGKGRQWVTISSEIVFSREPI